MKMHPITIQRGEAAFLAVAIVVAALAADVAWWWFPALFLAFDLSMLGYLAGPRVGAAAYNAVHAWIGPAVCATIAVATNQHAAFVLAATWGFHVAVDRALGYGLKLPTRFGDTHLGPVGQAPSMPS